MPRHPRRMETSNYFHVIVQGIERKFIFEKAKYKNKYYELMIARTERFNVKILAYCLMDNHAHFLLFTESVEALSLCMKEVNSIYAQYYNKTESRVGYVFRDRFLSEPIWSENQLYNCMAYIHFNPVKARLVLSPAAYFYSSYNDYLRKINIVDDIVIKLVFSTTDYIDLFKFIHLGYSDCLEYKESNNKKQIEQYFAGTDISSEEEIKRICLQLKANGISNRKIASILKMGRNVVNRLVKE